MFFPPDVCPLSADGVVFYPLARSGSPRRRGRRTRAISTSSCGTTTTPAPDSISAKTALTTANVNPAQFGLLFSLP